MEGFLTSDVGMDFALKPVTFHGAYTAQDLVCWPPRQTLNGAMGPRRAPHARQALLYPLSDRGLRLVSSLIEGSVLAGH